MFSFIRKWLGIKSREEILIEVVRRGAYVIDVRTPAEYKMGHIQQAVNISLDQIAKNSDKIRKIGKPVITCCENGGRSASARRKLRRKGIEVYNGGGWVNLKLLIRSAGS